MTTAELHHEFNLEWRANANNINRVFYSYEIDKFLNKAQDLLVDKYYKSFEKNEKSREAVQALLREQSGVYSSAGTKPNSSIYSITPVRYIVEEYAIVGTEEVTVIPITRDEYQSNKSNPFKRPYADLIWRLGGVDSTIAAPKLELIPVNGASIAGYKVVYIKEPESIDIVNDSSAINELSNSAQEELILEAVRQAYASITSVPDYELQTVEVKEREQLK